MVILVIGIISACSTTKKISTSRKKDFRPSKTPVSKIAAGIPDYRGQLTAVKGRAKAIVSGPKKTHRVTFYFSGNRQRSLINVKNSIGVEAAKILAYGDSLIIYNKIKKYARRISAANSDLQGINRLATVNLLKLINPVVEEGKVKKASESKAAYLLTLQSGGRIIINKKTDLIRQITQPASAGMPYSKIKYSGYNQIEKLTLPRRITIFSADGSSRIDLLVESLQINPPLKKLTIDLPDGIKIYHQ
jgi:hypothetical protein